MHKAIAALVLSTPLLLGGCAYLAGGAVGAGGTAGGYEVHLSNMREEVRKDYEAGRISKEEHDIRLDQIRRDSAVQ